MKGLDYLVFVGNGLNTLNISASKIDTHLLISGSPWWEPLGAYGEPGKARNMYDDYFPPTRLAFDLVLRIRDPARTVFQISTSQAPRTRRCTIPTAS